MPLTFVKISQLATALFLAGIEAGVLDTKGLPYIHEPFPDWRAREAGATSCALNVHTTPRPDVHQTKRRFAKKVHKARLNVRDVPKTSCGMTIVHTARPDVPHGATGCAPCAPNREAVYNPIALSCICSSAFSRDCHTT